VHGPAGSGKTRMLAFMSYLLKDITKQKILICCADNASADAMALQLLEIQEYFDDKDVVLRVYPSSFTHQILKNGIHEKVQTLEPHHIVMKNLVLMLNNVIKKSDDLY
jgi:signal recognition particle GTPase